MSLFNQGDLFESNEMTSFQKDLPNGDITLYEHFFSKEESFVLFKRLMENIVWRQDKIKYFGKMIDLPRLTAWYGDTDKSYTYSGIPMSPLAWTDDLLFIKEKIEAIAKVQFSSVLLNLYRQGSDSVSWHSDDEKELGANPVIGSVSFGQERPFQLKHKFLGIKKNIILSNGCFLLMKGETQHYWQHQVPKSSKKLNPRINLTFRVIK